MGKIIVKNNTGIKYINRIKKALRYTYIEFVNVEVGVHPAMGKTLGEKNQKTILSYISNNGPLVDSKRFLAFIDHSVNQALETDNIIKSTKSKGAIVVNMSKEAKEKLELNIKDKEYDVILADIKYDGYTRSLNAGEGEELYSLKNDFEYTIANSYEKEVKFESNFDIRKIGESEFKSYGQINQLLASNGKKQIMLPTIERKVIKKANKTTVVYDNCYMSNKSESLLTRVIEFDKRIKSTVSRRNTVFYDMNIKSKKEVYVSDKLVYVDLITANKDDRDLVLVSEAEKTTNMIDNGFYGVMLKEKIVSKNKLDVIDERESFEYFLKKEDAILCAELTGSEVHKYEVATASQSQSMNNMATFVRCDLVVSDRIISAVEKRIRKGQTVFGIKNEADCLYPEYLRSLRGREALLEMATALSFGTQISNEFINWVNKEHKEIDINVLKSIGKYHTKIEGSGVTANIRVSMSLTNSNGYLPMGGVKINKIGSVKYILTDELATELCEHYKTDIDTLKRAWKAEKLDGQSIVRKSFLVNALKTLGLNSAAGSVQSRTISQKGMLTAVSDEIYYALGFTGDITVEAESYKYALNNLAQDMFEISIVNVEKGRVRCRLNQQYIDSLAKYVEEDGVEYNNILEVNQTLVRVVDKYFNELESALEGNDLVNLLKLVGLYEKETSTIEDLNLEEGALSTKTALAVKIAGEKAMQDGYIKAKTYDSARASLSKLLDGGIVVEGGVKYVVSDPTAILRTDLMVRRVGDTLVNRYDKVVARLNDKNKFIAVDCINETEIKEGDIVISSRNEVALSNSHDAIWLNSPRDGEVLLMRIPNPYEGESQKVNLIELSNINRYIDMIDKDNNDYKLDCMDVLSQSPDTLILSGFNVILESLGGADTDGDRIHIILDKDIIDLKPDYKHSPIYITEAGDSEKTKMELGFNMIPAIIKKSFEGDCTGILTNTNTRIVEIKRILEFIRVLKIKKIDYMRYLNKIEGFVDTFLSIKDKAVEALEIEDLFYDFDANGNIDYKRPLVEEELIAKRWAMITTNDDLEELIKLCTKTTLMIKRLQEKAIASPKTGIYVKFEAISFLRGDGRMPYWFTPGKERTRFMTSFKDENNEDMSVTPMDAVFRRVLSRFEALDKKVYREYNDVDYNVFDPDYYGFEDDMGFDYEEESSSIPKTITFSTSEELAKVKYCSDSKMRLAIDGLDITSYRNASVIVSKLGEAYKEAMKKVLSVKVKAVKEIKMNNLIAILRESLDKIEEEYGFNSTYMAAYNCSEMDNAGNKLAKVPTSFSWVVCPDKLFMLLNSHFNENHTLMTRDEAIRKGYVYTPAYDKYVAVNISSEENKNIFNKEASSTVYSETFIVSVHGINNKYNTEYKSAKDALLTNFSSLTKEVIFDVVKTGDTIELHHDNTPVFTQISANCSALSSFIKITAKISSSQARNFDNGGKSVKLVVVGTK